MKYYLKLRAKIWRWRIERLDRQAAQYRPWDVEKIFTLTSAYSRLFAEGEYLLSLARSYGIVE